MRPFFLSVGLLIAPGAAGLSALAQTPADSPAATATATALSPSPLLALTGDGHPFEGATTPTAAAEAVSPPPPVPVPAPEPVPAAAEALGLVPAPSPTVWRKPQDGPEKGMIARAESPAHDEPAKVHGTISVDFEKVTIAELLRLASAVEKVDGVIHIVSSRDEGAGKDRAVVTISHPESADAPTLILGAAREAERRARPRVGEIEQARSPALEFPRLASLGRFLGFNPQNHGQPDKRRDGPMTVILAPPRDQAAESLAGAFLRTSREARRAARVDVDTTLAPFPEPELLNVGSHIDALSAGRPVSSGLGATPKTDAGVARTGVQTQAQPPAGSRRHVAKADESFDTLARSFYGDARYSRALWWANRNTVAWPGALAVGKPIVVPAVGELEPRMILAPGPGEPASAVASAPKLERIGGRYDPQVQPASHTAPAASAASAAVKGESDGVGGFAIHVVRPADTLRIIAREMCGDERKALEIIALNRDILTPEGRPRVGQRLLLPADAKPTP